MWQHSNPLAVMPAPTRPAMQCIQLCEQPMLGMQHHRIKGLHPHLAASTLELTSTATPSRHAREARMLFLRPGRVRGQLPGWSELSVVSAVRCFSVACGVLACEPRLVYGHMTVSMPGNPLSSQISASCYWNIFLQQITASQAFNTLVSSNTLIAHMALFTKLFLRSLAGTKPC